jgi:hypothetical protein
MKHFYLFGALLLTNSVYSMDEIVSVDSVVNHLNEAVEKQDPHSTNYWHKCLHMLHIMDGRLFNLNQRTQYENFKLELSKKTDPLLAKRNKEMERMVIFGRYIRERNEMTRLLIEKLQQNKCDINWTKILGSNIETTHSAEELKELRIEILQGFLSL